jgi:hypothetical protein
VNVLQNIQDKINCKRMTRPADHVTQTTYCKESTGSGNKKRRGEDDCPSYDYDFNELEGLFFSDDGDSGNADFGYTAEMTQSDERSTKFIRERADICSDHIIDPPGSKKSCFEADEVDDTNENIEADLNNERETNGGEDSDNNTTDRRNFFALMQFIQGTVLDDGSGVTYNSQAVGGGSDVLLPCSIHAVAEEFGLQGDEKQVAAYEVICSTFVLQVLNEALSNDTTLAAAGAIGINEQSTLEDIISSLKRMGAEEHLLMFLTGAGGCGKSHVISAARKFSHRFSQQVGIMFDAETFYLTAYVGSAAALWGGITIHTAAHLNRIKLKDEHCREWANVRILVIDEVSYFSSRDMENLDKKLRKLKMQPETVYGGVSIVFAGDLHQLEPVGGAEPFYYTYNLRWHAAINCAVILESNHRFREDPEYGELLKRIRSNTHTQGDIETINSRFVENRDDLPSNGEEVCYACAYNKERNSVSQGIFQAYIKSNPVIDSYEDPCDEVVVIEAVLRNGRRKCSKAFHETVFQQCGDTQVKAGKSKKVDPALKWYTGVPLMITSNEHIKKKRGNGTLCRGIRIKLKEGTQPQWKNYDGKKVLATSVDDIDHMLCEHWKSEKEGEAPVQFKLKPETDSVVISLPVHGRNVSVGGIKITQFGVNSNIATTGHKLQGMSKDNIVVTSWNYRFKNWIYVVLSRVRTLKGLHLLQKLPLSQDFSVDTRLLREEERLALLEEKLMLRRKEWD